MSPESALPEAIIIAICAVIAAVGAVLLVRRMFGLRSDLARRRTVMASIADRTRRDAAGLRARMERTTAAAERMRADGAAWEEDIGRATDSLRAQRDAIERLTRGRLAMVIRMASMVSKAARFAFLWR